jgi:hypothetical protein
MQRLITAAVLAAASVAAPAIAQASPVFEGGQATQLTLGEPTRTEAVQEATDSLRLQDTHGGQQGQAAGDVATASGASPMPQAEISAGGASANPAPAGDAPDASQNS